MPDPDDEALAPGLLDQVPAAVIAVDLEHRITLWSPGAAQLYGWPAHEAVGRSVRDLILVDQVPLAQQVAAQTHGGGVWEGEMVVRHQDGSELVVHVRNAPLRDASGEVVGVVGVSMDVAEARRLEGHRAHQLARASAAAAAAVERLGRLQRLTAALVPAQGPAEVVDTICREVVGAVGAAAAGVMLVDASGEQLELAGAVGYSEAQLAAYRVLPVDAATPVASTFRSGEPLLFGDAESFARALPGVDLPGAFVARACLPVTADDRVLGVLAMSFDGPRDFPAEDAELLVTIARMCGQALERSRLFSAEQRARQRDRTVAAASGLLASSLDVAETLQHLSALLVPTLADYVVVHLLDESGSRAPVAAVTHRDPAVTAWVRAQAETTPLDLEAPGGMGEVLRTGRAVVYPQAPRPVRERVAAQVGPELAAQLVPRTGIGVPMMAGGRVLGGLAVVRVAGDPFTDEQLGLVQEIADRAAIAVSHARAFERERTTALTLQRSLLPRELPAVPGLAYAWRYLPGTAGVHVGGDWYDVVELDHGRVAVLVGDVMGRGLQAAGVMGQLRAAARAHVTTDPSPAAVLRQLELAVARLEQGTITTALVGVLDPATRTFRYASAGHLPPLHARADGETAYLPLEPGPPLGADATSWPEATADLGPGDTLLLYTDGLVEDRTRPVTEGMELLRRSLHRPADPHAACEAALRGTGRDVGHDDDTALLAVTLAEPDQAAEHFVAVTVSGPTAAREARRVLRQALQAWQVPAARADDVVVVATELVVNAVLHAGGEVGVVLRRSSEGVRLEVRDRAGDRLPQPSLTSLVSAPGRPDDDRLDAVITALDQQGTTGRGMTLVASLADAWGAERDGAGKQVWAELGHRTARGGVASGPAPGGPALLQLRGLPVRLVLASASHLDDLERELTTGRAGERVARLVERGAELLAATADLRDPMRAAAREAVERGQRQVDVTTPVTAEAVDALFELRGMLADVVALSEEGLLLTPVPGEELAAFRTWWAEEVRAQLSGAAPRDCPFRALP